MPQHKKRSHDLDRRIRNNRAEADRIDDLMRAFRPTALKVEEARRGTHTQALDGRIPATKRRASS